MMKWYQFSSFYINKKKFRGNFPKKSISKPMFREKKYIFLDFFSFLTRNGSKKVKNQKNKLKTYIGEFGTDFVYQIIPAAHYLKLITTNKHRFWAAGIIWYTVHRTKFTYVCYIYFRTHSWECHAGAYYIVHKWITWGFISWWW